MDKEAVTFPMSSHVYLVFSLSLVIAAPLLFALIDSRHAQLTSVSWLVAAIGSSLLALLLLLSYRYAGTEQLSYREGLLYITSYCGTGWVYNTLIIVLPVLTFSFFYVAGFSLAETVSGKRGIAAKHLYKLIMRIYKHRAIQ